MEIPVSGPQQVVDGSCRIVRAENRIAGHQYVASGGELLPCISKRDAAVYFDHGIGTATGDFTA